MFPGRTDIGPTDGSPTDAWPPDRWSRGQLTHRSWKPTGLLTSRQLTQWLWFHMYICATRPFTSRQFSNRHMNHRWFYPACLSTPSQLSYRPMNNRRFCPIRHFTQRQLCYRPMTMSLVMTMKTFNLWTYLTLICSFHRQIQIILTILSSFPIFAQLGRALLSNSWFIIVQMAD